jgi:UDP-glucose 4-epimerase
MYKGETTWLITGSSGYLGSHLIQKMKKIGMKSVGIDLYGPQDVAKPDHFFLIDVRNIQKISDIVESFGIKGIINLAALKSVAESFIKPELYFEVNTGAVAHLLEVCQTISVDYFIQASSAAVYGDFKGDFAREDGQVAPISPYGESKLLSELALKDAIDNSALKGTSLRYFNIIGAGSPELKDRSKSNVIPIFENALRMGTKPSIFGSDLGTQDGTCVRDYVDVRDVAQAHVDFIGHLENIDLPKSVNIGSGVGHSVLDVGKRISKSMRTPFDPNFLPPRLGDPVCLIADIKIAVEFGFEPRHNFSESIESSISAK